MEQLDNDIYRALHQKLIHQPTRREIEHVLRSRSAFT